MTIDSFLPFEIRETSPQSKTLIDIPGVLLADISIETVQSLVQQVAAIDIDFSANTAIEAAEAAIENSSEIIQALSEQIGTGLVSISGSVSPR